MEKDPAVLFYTADFLTGVAGFTMEERGQYITLLSLQHQTGHLTEKTIRLQVGSVSVDVMKKFVMDEDGLYYNEVMDRRIEERRKFVDSRKVNGSLGGRPKRNEKPNGKPNGYPIGKPTDNLLEDENENRNKDTIEVRIEKFKEKVNTINHGFTPEQLERFISYWTDHNPGDRKCRWEKEKNFYFNSRIATWKSNIKNYDKPTATNRVVNPADRNKTIEQLRREAGLID